MMKNLAIFLLLIIVTTSCDTVMDATGHKPTSIDLIPNLKLESNWHINLLKEIVVDGSVENDNNRTVDHVIIEARMDDGDGHTVDTQRFEVGVPITANGKATFKNKFSESQKVMYVYITIFDAQAN